MANKCWRVLSIYHAGKMGKRGEERIDGLYPDRKERIFIIDPNKIDIGKPLFMECAANFMKSTITSPVMSFSVKGERLKFRTVNSVYILEEMKDVGDVND